MTPKTQFKNDFGHVFSYVFFASISDGGKSWKTLVLPSKNNDFHEIRPSKRGSILMQFGVQKTLKIDEKSNFGVDNLASWFWYVFFSILMSFGRSQGVPDDTKKSPKTCYVGLGGPSGRLGAAWGAFWRHLGRPGGHFTAFLGTILPIFW